MQNQVYLLTMCKADGDHYQIFSNLDSAKKSFNSAIGGDNHRVVLCSSTQEEVFNLKSSVIEEWNGGAAALMRNMSSPK